MRLLIVKTIYAVCSPIVRLYLAVSDISIGRNVYFCGFPIILRKLGSKISIGKNCKFASVSWANLIGINHRCMISTSSKSSELRIGNNCGFSGVTIWCFDKITIGNNVRVGANVTIMDGDAHQDDPRAGKNCPIKIEDNVWIGANAIVLKGVTIGRNSLIGAGSVVAKDIPENVVAAGNPCRVIKSLDDSVIKDLNQK